MPDIDAFRDDDPGESEPSLTDRLETVITEHPLKVVLAFAVVTVLLASGIGGGGEQQAGTDQFTEGLEEQEAYEEMQADFASGARDEGNATASLFLEDGRNALSKPNLLRMLEFQERAENEDGLRVASTTSPASLVARQLDPSATTPETQYRAIERASQRQLEAAIADADETAGLPVSTDFTRESAAADVAQVAVTYDVPPNADTDDTAELQSRTVELANEIDGYESGDNVVVFGDAIIEEEMLQLLGDTSMVVFPAALVLILFFLLVAYRDPIDLGLGLVSLLLTIVWTFGFMGHAGIPFSDSLITVFPLLLAVGIDFGIHIINRYREERAAGAAIGDAMGITTGQMSGAFMIVTLTTVIGFAANLTSSLSQLRDFGIVASVGIAFTFLIFAVFLPAGKVGLDRLREGTRFPAFGSTPLGSDDSILGRVLPIGTRLAKIAPAVVLVTALLFGGVAASYGTGVDSEFSQEAFFPDETRLDQYERLPGPLQPGEYTFLTVLDYLEEDFDQGFVGSVTVYVDDPDVRSNTAFREVDRALQDPPDAFKETDRRAEATSIVSVTEQRAATDPEFAATVKRTDSNGDELPDRDVDRVYDELLESDEGPQYVTSDRSATRIEYQVEPDADQSEATAAAKTVADGMDMDATATGTMVVNQAVIDRITESAMRSLVVAFVLTAVFLMLSYRWLEGRMIYGVINLVPVLVTVAMLAGSMRLFDIPLSPFNAPILSVSIGLGVDYTVHFMHRFVDEYESGADVHEALQVTVRGTGGALTGSMLTTVCGLGVLYFALIPMIMEFGLLLAMGVLYAYLTSIVILPSTIVVWDRLERRFGPIGGVPW
ncbi:MMPL family transporter [Natrinema thermotolerans]|uniref:MMPL family transporter n=1 Tax=Natrinema thermotolerans TaxID=121872 RepID=A0AAF0P8F4_9EURY|nr:MMPL family transporter [Natrinema thermotolerans]QCC59896.1 Patched family protein [Natrinema thermotolerans]WMT06892.1 MMPL family transporter [Natrinema thermotolerans]